MHKSLIRKKFLFMWQQLCIGRLGFSQVFYIKMELINHFFKLLCPTLPFIKTALTFAFFFITFSRAVPAAYGVSQARGLIRAVDTGLHQRHRN